MNINQFDTQIIALFALIITCLIFNKFNQKIISFIEKYILSTVIFTLGSLAIFYLSSNKIDNTSLGDTAAFGQLGDYVGGILNPIFGFITILLLIHNLKTQRAHEKSRLNFIKNEALLNNFQQLIVSFSKILSTSQESWSDNRKEKLQKLEEEIFHAKTMITTLNNQLGEKVDYWYSTKNSSHESVMTLTTQSLSQLGSDLTQTQKVFLMNKSKELSSIYHDFLEKLNS